MNFEGAVAVVTGAAGGIGAALAKALHARGSSVVLTDLTEEAVQQRAEELNAIRPDSAVALAGDAAESEHIQACVDLAEQRFGPVDLYAANAGIGGGLGLEATDQQWQQALDVNVLAHVRAAKLLVPQWLERGSGHFLSTASAAGLLTQIGSATYAVSKHAAVAFSEWLSVTYGSRGIGVSCLCPMGVNTNMLRGPSTATRAVTDAGGVLEPDDVAASALEAVAKNEFLVLPHREIHEFWRRKSSDYERWLAGMRRYQDSLV